MEITYANRRYQAIYMGLATDPRDGSYGDVYTLLDECEGEYILTPIIKWRSS